jgi:type VI protein secretion system component Hcp
LSDGTPQLNLALEQGQLITSADIALGSLTIHLTGVVLTHVTVGEARSDHAQETIGFSYKSVAWSWQVPGGVKRTVTFDKATGAGGGAATAFKYGYFAAGVTPDATLVPVRGYTHDVACPSPTAVCNNGAFAVQKAVGNETIDELGGAASGVAGGSVDLQWFLTAASASNSVKLTNTVVVSVDLSTKDDGSLLENVAFGYVQITWRAGITETAWDISKNAAP